MHGGGFRRLKCRDRDLFSGAIVSDAVSSVVLPPTPSPDGSYLRLLNHFIIETMASVVLMYSSVYVPESGHDFMKQYVSSIAILAVMLTIKDKMYFCPDGTPMTTAVLACSGAYTDKLKHTDSLDVFVRVVGQLVGWVIVCFAVVGSNKSLFVFGTPTYYYSIDGVTEIAWMNLWFAVLNETVDRMHCYFLYGDAVA